MGGVWHATRIENKVSCGVPDVHFAGMAYRHKGCGVLTGWIELKVVPKWPKHPKTPIRLPHLTDDQVNWHLTHHMHHGKSWLMIEDEGVVFVFPGRSAPDLQEGKDSDWWYTNSRQIVKKESKAPGILLGVLATVHEVCSN